MNTTQKQFFLNRAASKKQFRTVRTACATSLLPLLLLLILPAVVQGQFNYTTNSGTVTITGYTGGGGDVTIPSTILVNGVSLPVTSIGDNAFAGCTNLTSVTIPNSVTSIGGSAFDYCIRLTSATIPNSVTSIGDGAFENCYSLSSVTIPNSVTSIGSGPFAACTSLSAITVGALNSFYSSVDGVLFNKSQTTLIQYPAGKAGSYNTIPNSVTNIGDDAFYRCRGLTSVTIPNSVTSIGDSAFYECISLTSVTIGNSVTSIGDRAFSWCTSLTSVTIPNSVTSIGSEEWSEAFGYCTNLTGVYFKGNAPTAGSYVFPGADNATVYYLAGTTGWGPTFGGRPAVLWNPQVQTSDASFGVQTNQFGFTITGNTNLVIVVEACTDLANPIWSPVGTNTLTGGSSYFSDPKWTNCPARFYRLRSP